MRVFAQRLKELREEKRLSQVGLAQATGISKSAIGAWEVDRTDISGDNLIILAKYFGVTVGYLLGTEDV